MGKGRLHASEMAARRDAETGLAYRKLTAGPGDSHHLYFTNSGWHRGGRHLVFASTRDGSANLHSMDLATGRFVQLTDEPPGNDGLIFSAVNPRRPELYFWRGPQLRALDLDSLAERALFSAPAGYATDMLSVTADGAAVCTAVYEDLRHRFPIDLLKGYVGARQIWAARPHSIVFAIDTTTGQARPLHAAQAWIGHVNASPTQPTRATFCHEGPWGAVENRIWGLDLADGRCWPIRPRRAGEAVGHEYWLADGARIGFHGAHPDGTAFLGSVRHDGTNILEHPFSMQGRHVHSNRPDLIVTDGTRRDRHLYLGRLLPDGRTRLTRLLHHGCRAATQTRHVHPRFSPDGRRLLFVTDIEGQGDLYDLSLRDAALNAAFTRARAVLSRVLPGRRR